MSNKVFYVDFLICTLTRGDKAAEIATSRSFLAMTNLCIVINNSMFINIDLHRVFSFFKLPY